MPAMYLKSSLSFQALTNYKRAHIQQGDGPCMYMQEHLYLLLPWEVPNCPSPSALFFHYSIMGLHKRKEIAFDCP